MSSSIIMNLERGAMTYTTTRSSNRSDFSRTPADSFVQCLAMVISDDIFLQNFIRPNGLDKRYFSGKQ
jgi:hypothetical protein